MGNIGGCMGAANQPGLGASPGTRASMPLPSTPAAPGCTGGRTAACCGDMAGGMMPGIVAGPVKAPPHASGHGGNGGMEP
mmetsp:Transcript_9908/g.27974  ORF Transcript_9908/g.27974 Transcript_9908/m.27974 type:complete len:80 (-) Transcript_9908:433-672(-)